MISLLYLLAGVILGGVIGWFLGSSRSLAHSEANRVEQELRNQLAKTEGELQTVRQQLAQAASACAASTAHQEATSVELATLREEHRIAKSEAASQRDQALKMGQELATLRADVAAAQQRLLDQHQHHESNMRELRDNQSKALSDLREAFKALSSDALRQVQPEFLRLANETFAKFTESAKGDLSQRQQAIATLVKPLEEHLTGYQQRLQQAESSQTILLGEVRKQLESLTHQSQSLSTETLQLRRVLSSNQARGRWGEETLRRVVETAGLSAHCDFTEQAQMDDSKPDLIIHLPEDRLIIVDAKVPDLDFLDGLEVADVPRRSEVLMEHAAKLKQTIKLLADRDYPSRFPNALDYVVLFLPAESLFSAALEGDRELMLWAQNRRILLATPSSLLAILRSVSISWQHYAQTQNARAIATAAQELYSRVCKFTEHFERVRDGLEKATSAYNQAVGSYERQVRPSAERLKGLGGGVEGREIAEVVPLEASLRLPPTAP